MSTSTLVDIRIKVKVTVPKDVNAELKFTLSNGRESEVATGHNALEAAARLDAKHGDDHTAETAVATALLERDQVAIAAAQAAIAAVQERAIAVQERLAFLGATPDDRPKRPPRIRSSIELDASEPVRMNDDSCFTESTDGTPAKVAPTQREPIPHSRTGS